MSGNILNEDRLQPNNFTGKTVDIDYDMKKRMDEYWQSKEVNNDTSESDGESTKKESSEPSEYYYDDSLDVYYESYKLETIDKTSNDGKIESAAKFIANINNKYTAIGEDLGDSFESVKLEDYIFIKNNVENLVDDITFDKLVNKKDISDAERARAIVEEVQKTLDGAMGYLNDVKNYIGNRDINIEDVISSGREQNYQKIRDLRSNTGISSEIKENMFRNLFRETNIQSLILMDIQQKH